MDALHQLAERLAQTSAVTVLTGAGCSTDSGIPDYRGPQGLWARDPEARRPAGRTEYLADPALRREVWERRRAHPVWQARPNAAHRALTELERSGRLRALVTQNIDGLHQEAGSSPAQVLELHGTLRQAECLSCGARRPMRETLERIERGERDPPCLACGGILTSATVSFGQPLDRTVLARAVLAARDCDVFLVAGSSLTVQPAAGLCRVAVQAGAHLAIVNGQPTPYDPLAGTVLRLPVGQALPQLVPRVA